MARLLVVHHTPSPALDSLHRAVLDGAGADGLEDVEVVSRPALLAGATDALEADGYIVGAPANLGSMAGALKHFFDLAYYPCLEATVGRPYGVYLHGNDDLGGAQRDLERIVTGLRWREAHAAVHVTGAPSADDLAAAWDLGATVAANLLDP
ncbi:MAG: flavodoxin family protein [Acidimicrobiia bacterium]|nr:flavodoxin family protein [Acidimicrobiia bacterium]